MRRIVVAIALIVSGTFQAVAALPPQYQRQAELVAIINDPAITDAFGFGGILSIEFIQTDLYRLTGGNCTLDVRIEDLPTDQPEGWAGPRQFKTVFGEPVCK